MELQQMRYVVAVAETANFTRAAERCHVVQSALSHQIARLERELGARLFDRTSRRVHLTPAGEAFLPAARQALEAAERARAEVAAAAGEIRGRLAIGAIPTVSSVDLPRLLVNYRTRYPRVHISLRSAISEEMIEQVKEGTLDVAVLGLPPAGRVVGLRGHELARGGLVAIVAPGHRLADAGEVALAELADEEFVDFPTGTGARVQSDDAFEAAGVRREVAFEVNAIEFMTRFVRHGLGVGMVPTAFADELAGVRVLRITDATARVEVLVWSRSRPSPPAAALLELFDIDPESYS
ncbi:LysR family transcriptional regulator [Actinomadura barringtoniae]|uniref:LysR family transcriptional regulator n=1 Tax=Actinomadura barringtoniae TaxID=1427535 RepID=A0A939TCS8_9ACTN|nr:LysR family transcriptional regulator [Actinomadura barringtoniae]MBO2451570.1 LysR family transcriptional regulator [Actinomadura barringtoniae]